MKGSNTIAALVRARLFELVSTAGQVVARLGRAGFPFFQHQIEMIGTNVAAQTNATLEWWDVDAATDSASVRLSSATFPLTVTPAIIEVSADELGATGARMMLGMAPDGASVRLEYDPSLPAGERGVLSFTDSSSEGQLVYFRQLSRAIAGRISRTNNTGPHAASFFVPGLSVAVDVRAGRRYLVVVHFGSLLLPAGAAGDRWTFSVRADATDLSRVAEINRPGGGVGQVVQTCTGTAEYVAAATASVAFSVLGTLTAGATAVSVNGTAAVPSFLEVIDQGDA